MSKLVTNSRKAVLSAIGAFAQAVGATSASAATSVLIQQPKCPKHLIK